MHVGSTRQQVVMGLNDIDDGLSERSRSICQSHYVQNAIVCETINVYNMHRLVHPKTNASSCCFHLNSSEDKYIILLFSFKFTRRQIHHPAVFI